MSLALTAGFGVGGALFVAPLMGVPTRAWATAAAQAHAHVQLFGWAGLMVLGVGFHFLPRLRGRSLAQPERARLVLALLGTGLIVRAISQPLFGVSDAPAWRVLLVLSGVLELVGVTVALALLRQTLAGDPPVRGRAGLWQVVPFLATGFAAFWLALLVSLVGTGMAALAGTSLVAGRADRLQNLLGLYGFLVPLSVGMGVRLFPLHFAARLPGLGLSRAGLIALMTGLGLRVAGDWSSVKGITAAGLAANAVALALFVAGSRVFAPRRVVPGGRRPWYAEPTQLLGLTAFAWLALDALLLIAAACAVLIPSIGPVPLQAEWHILGAGFVTLLIFGEGLNLLPGFAGRVLRSEALAWATLGTGNLAALLRVGPLLLPAAFPDSLGHWALGASGFAGLLAVALFAANLSGDRPVRSAA